MFIRSRTENLALVAGTGAMAVLWYINGTRFGFSLTWLAIMVFGIPLVIALVALYFRRNRGLPIPQWAEGLLLLFSGVLLFVGGFETLGWAGLFFVLLMLALSTPRFRKKRRGLRV